MSRLKFNSIHYDTTPSALRKKVANIARKNTAGTMINRNQPATKPRHDQINRVHSIWVSLKGEVKQFWTMVHASSFMRGNDHLRNCSEIVMCVVGHKSLEEEKRDLINEHLEHCYWLIQR